jgi:hypothetical protein
MLSSAQRKTLEALRDLAPEDRTSSKWEAMTAGAGVGRTAFFAAKKHLLEEGQVTGGGGRGAVYEIPEQPTEDDGEPF